MAEASTEAVIVAFNDALNARDIDGAMALMTDDCIFENTVPPPDGERVVGHAGIRAVWESLMLGNPAARFDAEEIVTCGDRCTVLWRYNWGSGHVRGIDLFKVRDGKICEKLSYVKG